MLALSEHLPVFFPLSKPFEISYVSVWSEQIANAMIINMLVMIYLLVRYVVCFSYSLGAKI